MHFGHLTLTKMEQLTSLSSWWPSTSHRRGLQRRSSSGLLECTMWTETGKLIWLKWNGRWLSAVVGYNWIFCISVSFTEFTRCWGRRTVARPRSCSSGWTWTGTDTWRRRSSWPLAPRTWIWWSYWHPICAVDYRFLLIIFFITIFLADILVVVEKNTLGCRHVTDIATSGHNQ